MNNPVMLWTRRQRACRALAAFAAIGAAVMLTGAQAQPGRSADEPFLGYRDDGYPAISYPSRMMVLSFVRPGIIGELNVDENDIVEPGEVIARQRDDVQEQVVAAARLAAEDETQLEVAKKRLELSEYEYGNHLAAFEKDAASPSELERARIEVELRKLDVQGAKQNRLQSQTVYRRELAVLEDMVIKSKIHGRIVRVQRFEGEAVDGLEPVVRVVATDPLWMDVEVPVQLGMHIEEGTSAIVQWRDVADAPPSTGHVLFVSSIADSAANRIVVRLEVANPDELPAGLHALVRFPEAEEGLKQARK